MRYTIHMSTRFVSAYRNQPLLLPPDLRDWITEDDVVHFVIQAVEGLPLDAFNVNVKGSGSAQYPPHMMLSLLIYCYANGVFSSRRIERATHRDIAVRYLTCDTHPDHDTIAKFRRENFEAVAACFLHVLELARELKLLKVGTVSVDGTTLKANAKQLRRKHDFRPRPAEEKEGPEIRSAFVRQMKEEMERDESRAKYRLRKQTVEPVFGTIKQWMGFRQFLLRGHDKVSGEWQLVTLAYNMKRLWSMQCSPQQTHTPG